MLHRMKRASPMQLRHTSAPRPIDKRCLPCFALDREPARIAPHDALYLTATSATASGVREEFACRTCDHMLVRFLAKQTSPPPSDRWRCQRAPAIHVVPAGDALPLHSNQSPLQMAPAAETMDEADTPESSPIVEVDVAIDRSGDDGSRSQRPASPLSDESLTLGDSYQPDSSEPAPSRRSAKYLTLSDVVTLAVRQELDGWYVAAVDDRWVIGRRWDGEHYPITLDAQPMSFDSMSTAVRYLRALLMPTGVEGPSARWDLTVALPEPRA